MTQKTGQIDRTYTGSTVVKPSLTVAQNNRGNNVVRLWGRRNQRTWNRGGKGNVTHYVSVPGTPTVIRSETPQTL